MYLDTPARDRNPLRATFLGSASQLWHCLSRMGESNHHQATLVAKEQNLTVERGFDSRVVQLLHDHPRCDMS